LLETLIFIEKIATCYISSVGAGLAPALDEYNIFPTMSDVGWGKPFYYGDNNIIVTCAMAAMGWGKPSPYYFSSLLDYFAYFTFS